MMLVATVACCTLVSYIVLVFLKSRILYSDLHDFEISDNLHPGIFAPKKLSEAMATICGAKTLPRTEVTKKASEQLRR